jgi:glucose/arabinose dehydrogenase
MKKLFYPLLLLLCPFASNAQWNIVPIVSGLDYPICVAEAPDGRFFISLKGGDGSGAPQNAKVVVYQANGTLQNTLWDFTDSVEVYFERGVLGVELDPDFSTNHYVYVFYNHTNIGNDRIRVFRFTEVNGVGTNPTLIFEVDDTFTAGNHTGGNIHFRPSDPDHLYISIGDRATSSNAPNLGTWAGKMLRIHKSGSIPTDNPFYDDGIVPSGNDDRIWAYGLRNTFDFTFSTINDSLYGSENGQNTYDEVNIIMKGRNYGWPSCEGITGSCSTPGFVAPIEVWPAPLPAVTGIIHYSDTLIPNMYGHLLVANYDYGTMHDITLGNAPVYNTFISRTAVSGINLAGITDMIQGMNGCLYVIDGGYTLNGALRRICPQLAGHPEYTGEQLNLYPNPADDVLNVEVPNGEGTYEVYSVSGKCVMKGELTDKLSISALDKGVYMFKAFANGTVYFCRFVKS